MKLLLDTNVISEPVSRSPNARVVEWLAAQDPFDLFLSVVTLAEVEEGVARLPASRRRSRLESWRDGIAPSAGERLMPVDERIALAWGAIHARLAAEHRSIAPLDGFIAATAEVHDMTVVTRNVRHFAPWGGPVLNPWIEG